MTEDEFPHHPNEALFYVYTYTNSLTGKVFYVGKGCDNRYTYHFREAQRKHLKKPTRAVLAIRTIWEQGGKVIVRKVHKDVPCHAALKLEKKLILQFGYGQLVNLPHYKTCQCKQVKDVSAVLAI